MAICIKAKGSLNLVVCGQNMKLPADGDITIIVSSELRTALTQGEFTVAERNPTITATVVVPADRYVRDLQELCNCPVIVELADGRIFSAEGASNVSQDPYTANTNSQPLELICESMVELLPVAA